MKTREPDPLGTCLEMIKRGLSVGKRVSENEVGTHWKKCLLGDRYLFCHDKFCEWNTGDKEGICEEVVKSSVLALALSDNHTLME